MDVLLKGGGIVQGVKWSKVVIAAIALIIVIGILVVFHYHMPHNFWQKILGVIGVLIALAALAFAGMSAIQIAI